MRGKSHQQLGLRLAREYLIHAPTGAVRLFLIGCVQPDKNPATYLKGSLRELWLRGHHWPNSRRYIQKLISRLERRRTLRPFDYYSLGKLVHYIVDAFTYPHNPHFPGSLADHRQYEVMLQHRFLHLLKVWVFPAERDHLDPAATICALHRRYAARPSDPERDCRYCLRACCVVMSALLLPAQKMSFSG